ncbi:sugar-binding domain-containing protein [Celerinatantimonas yamalensis]|uniref:Sugar-binding domain-containing protein n=1 Tax=Celerinatantimonas yamalensis TaxID=559956 RepID=A0ABW9GDL3_9GAMM
MVNESQISVSEASSSEEELLARVAWFYYHDNLTQEEIGKIVGLSRLKVSRLLDKGRKSGIIKVYINSKFTGCFALEESLKRRFSLKHIKVLPHLEGNMLNERLGVGAAQLLAKIVQPEQVLAIGFGDTVIRTMQHCSFFFKDSQLKIITLTGGVGPYMRGIGQLEESCRINIIPTPLRASSVNAANMFKKENSVNDMMLAAQRADLAVLGIGSTSQREGSTLIKTGYINNAAQLEQYQNAGAVGDILGYFIDEQGSVKNDFKIHDELISLPLERLSNIPIVIGVAGGPDKVDSILASLRAKHINALVTDEKTAGAILTKSL